MADGDPSGGPPAFEDTFGGDDVEQRVYGTILQTRDPTAASEIAERAGCDPKTARKYLTWFTELGIVTRHDGRPATYERNDTYFEWRRIDRLATDHSVDALQQRVQELTARIDAYEDAYDATDPAAVDAVTAAEASDDRTIDEVYSDLGDWETAREERRRHERARQQRSGAGTGRVSG
ncbi:DUF7342 family protein [Halovivax cerinus]|uniref:Sugar-specific transcriptional regulator TrmB n=1 Tax=Halovivax cerinus TaxID=1487865 RepID=A0ABD5NQ31_9EURY|nr:sugar-specific transcriptional regulator TrmB [Halovivax cerinus]